MLVRKLPGLAREYGVWVGAGVGVVAVIVVVAMLVGGGGGAAKRAGTTLTAGGSSWIPGQPSLILSPAYLSIADRAQSLAEQREAERVRLLQLIEARRKAAEERRKQEALRRYEEAKRKAEAAYRAALKRAAELKRKRAKELAEAKRKRAEALRKLLEKLRVNPGEECRVEAVRRLYNCVRGRLPLEGEKSK